jgi:hypothetical protein
MEATMVSNVKRPVILALVFISLTANSWSQEAPRSFDAQNGLLPQKQFEEALDTFKEVETPAKGLGIHFNEASCAACHVAPGAKRLPGGSGPITEIRAGHLGTNGEFIAAPGGTLITTKAVGNATPEIMALSATQNVRDHVITPS